MEVEAAERALAAAEGRDVARARKGVDKAHRALRDRSARSARDDGKGNVKTVRGMLPGSRDKQPRTFPVAVPHDDVVHLCWAVDATPDVVDALDRVAARVARLGHSSSLVAARFFAGAVDAGTRDRHRPDPGGDAILRVTAPGQLDALDAAYARHQAVEPRVLPCAFHAYTTRPEPPTPAPGTVFDAQRWIAYAVVGDGGRPPRYGPLVTEALARALRGAVMRSAGDDAPAALTGHRARDLPADSPHVAWVPLPWVGLRHATGALLGAAVVPPVDLDDADRRALYAAVADAERAGGGLLRLFLAGGRPVTLQHVDHDPRATLSPTTWTRASQRWATASPIALDRNPGDLRSRDPAVVSAAVARAEQTVADAAERVGLPRPVAVWVHPRSAFTGPEKAFRYMPFPSSGRGPRRVCVHAELVFEREVRGPVLLGAGRHFGLGLCKPVEEPS